MSVPTDQADALMVNLKILASLQVYNRLNTKEKYFRVVGPSSGTLPVWLQRWWAGENREDALVKIQELFEHAHKLLKHDKIAAFEKKRLKDHLMQALHGVTALRKTYEDDATTIAKLDVLTDFGIAILQNEDLHTHLTKDFSNLVLQDVLKASSDVVPPHDKMDI